ncbi:hypothetical protein DFH09DRAFT_1383851 [Mycena vulgaris]|nr:hypothetical protein DFH09DRAFT_1383851 [Mycena vulgaris]
MPSLFSRARTASTSSKHKAMSPPALSPVPKLPRTDDFGRTRSHSLPYPAAAAAPTCSLPPSLSTTQFLSNPPSRAAYDLLPPARDAVLGLPDARRLVTRACVRFSVHPRSTCAAPPSRAFLATALFISLRLRLLLPSFLPSHSTFSIRPSLYDEGLISLTQTRLLVLVLVLVPLLVRKRECRGGYAVCSCACVCRVHRACGRCKCFLSASWALCMGCAALDADCAACGAAHGKVRLAGADAEYSGLCFPAVLLVALLPLFLPAFLFSPS